VSGPSVDFLSALKHNPTPFLLVIAIAVPTFVLALVGLIMMREKSRAARPIGFAALASALFTIAVGVAGWLWGRHMADVAATYPGLSAAEKTQLVAAGHAEALYNLWFSVGMTAPIIVMAAILLLATKRKV